MKLFFKKINFALYGAALVCALLGLLLLLYTEQAISTIQIVLGVAMILYGVAEILRRMKQGLSTLGGGFGTGIGILLIILGIWMCTGPLEVASLIMIFLALVLLLHGSIDLGFGFRQKQLGFSGWGISMIAAIITIAAGVIVLINPFESAALVYQIMGVFILLDGVFDLFLAVLMQILEFKFERAQIKAAKMIEQNAVAAKAIDAESVAAVEAADADYAEDPQE